MRLGLITDVSSVIGTGHVARCRALINHLPFQSISLTVFGSGCELRNYFPEAKIVKIKDWSRLQTAEPIEGFDLLILDIPMYCKLPWELISNLKVKKIVIDDHGGYVAGDVIVNGTVLNQYHIYEPLCDHAKYYIGPEYSIINPIFSQHRWSLKNSNTLTIIVGSGKEAGDWLISLMISFKKNPSSAKINVVVGKTFQEIKVIQSLTDSLGVNLYQDLTPSALSNLFLQSTVILATAGMVMYEAIASNIPIVAYPQIEDLIGEAAWFHQKGACINLTSAGKNTEDAIRTAFELMKNKKKLLRMSKIQRALVDGRGIERICKIISLLKL